MDDPIGLLRSLVNRASVESVGSRGFGGGRSTREVEVRFYPFREREDSFSWSKNQFSRILSESLRRYEVDSENFANLRFENVQLRIDGDELVEGTPRIRFPIDDRPPTFDDPGLDRGRIQ